MADVVVGGSLRGDRRAVEIARSVQSAGLEWSIDSVPSVSLSLADRGWRLLRELSPVLDADDDGRLDASLTVVVGGREWRLTGVGKADDGVTVKLAHWLPEQMDDVRGQRSAPAGSMSAMQWVGSLARECRVPAVLLDSPRRTGLPVGGGSPSTHDDARALRDRERAPGFADGVRLSIMGVPATRAQLRVLSTALSVADRRRSPVRAYESVCAAGIVESRCTDLRSGDADSEGWLQVRVGIHGAAVARSVEKSTEKFLGPGFTGAGGADHLARTTSLSAAQIAQKVQGSAHPSRYQSFDGVDVAAEARAIVKAWRGGAPAAVDQGAREAWSRGKDGEREGSWAAAARVATDRGWRCCVAFDPSGDRLLVGPDSALIAARPVATIREGMPGVESIRWDVDRRSGVKSMKVQVRAELETLLALAAQPVIVEGEGRLADGYRGGRWLVTGLSVEAVGGQRGTIELSQPTAEKAATTPAKSAPKSTAGDDPRIRKLVRRADEITAKKYPYAWGGGHASFAGPYDCSGGVSAALHAAGLLDSPLTTAGLIKWGESGEGDVLTVWVKETGNPRESHCYLTVKSSDGTRVFEAGGVTGALTGWRPRGQHPRTGFKPRHWKGL